MPAASVDLPQGVLNLLILKSLSRGAIRGSAISEEYHRVSRAALQIPEGSVHAALLRMQRRGWVKVSWGVSANNRRAKYYTLTRAGAGQLAAVAGKWDRLTAAIMYVLRMA